MNTLVAGALLIAAVSPAAFAATPIAHVPYVSGPVTITTCSLDENTHNGTVNPFSLRIRFYVNPSNRRPTTIKFRVRYGQKAVTVSDGGTYYFDRPYGLQFSLFSGVRWAGPMPDCRFLSATFTDAKALTAGDASSPPTAEPAESPTSAASPEPTISAPSPAPSST